MFVFRFIFSFAFVLAMSLVIVPPTSASGAVNYLYSFDKTTYSGAMEVFVDLYAAPDKQGNYGNPQRYRAHLLFERPDRFRIVLHPGKYNEFRAVAEAGFVRWQDRATGLSGTKPTTEVVDPLALALLGTVGELLDHSQAVEIPVYGQTAIYGASVRPKILGSALPDNIVWFSADGQPLGFEFAFNDRSKVFVSVLTFKQNVNTDPSDFQL
jgi:hypothetical protein